MCPYKQELVAAGLLLLTAGSVTAGVEDRDPMLRQQFCKSNPERCKEIRQREQVSCKDNPADCKSREALRAAREAKCESDPASCRHKSRPAPTPLPAPAAPKSQAPKTNEGEPYHLPPAPPNDF